MMKKVLYVSSHPHLNFSAPSGPGTHMREVVEGLRGLNCEVELLIAGGVVLSAANSSIKYNKHSLKKWIPTFVWSTLKELKLILHNKEWRKKIEQRVVEFKPDLIYERSYTLSTAAAEIAKKYNIPLYSEVNAPYPEEKKSMDGAGLFHFLSERSEERIARDSKRIFVVSSALKNYFTRKWNIGDERIIVTPNAVKSGFEEVDQAIVAKLRRQLGLTSNDKVVGFVGSIFPYHGVDALITSFIRLKEKLQIDELKMMIVGDGETLPKLKALASESEYSRDIIFTGNINHQLINQYISVMDITVMARSNWYGSPVKIFEYGILKKAVIAPDTIPVLDVMEHQRDGLLIGEEESELYEALNDLIHHPEKATQLALNWHFKVTTSHTWERVAQMIYNTF